MKSIAPVVFACVLAASFVAPAQAAEDFRNTRAWGQCVRDLGSEAVAACGSLLSIPALTAKDRAEILTARAKQYEGTQNYQRALDDLDIAVGLDPDLLEARKLRGTIEGAAGRYDAALADYDRVIALDPKDSDVLAQSCVLRGGLGRELDLALGHCDAVIALSPGQAGALGARGLVWLRKGETAKALADFNAALALEPRAVSALYMRGIAKRFSGDTQGGDADIAAATAQDPETVKTYQSFGVAP